jgi:hypothetical protein
MSWGEEWSAGASPLPPRFTLNVLAGRGEESMNMRAVQGQPTPPDSWHQGTGKLLQDWHDCRAAQECQVRCTSCREHLGRPPYLEGGSGRAALWVAFFVELGVISVMFILGLDTQIVHTMHLWIWSTMCYEEVTMKCSYDVSGSDHNHPPAVSLVMKWYQCNVKSVVTAQLETHLKAVNSLWG